MPYRPLGQKNNEKNENVIARKRQPKEQPKEGSRLEHSCVTGRARSREPWTHRVVGSPADGTRVGAARNATNMIRRWIALVALVAWTTNAQMQKSREVRSHEEYHKKRQDQLNRKAQSRKNALKKGGTQSKTLHELRMKKQHKNRAKKKQKRRPGL